MAFILGSKSDSFWYPLIIQVVADDGRTRSHQFEFRFKRLTRSRINQLLKAISSDQMADADPVERDVDWVMDIADGWRGVQDEDGAELPFTRDNVFRLIDQYPHAASTLLTAWSEANAGGAKRKNS